MSCRTKFARASAARWMVLGITSTARAETLRLLGAELPSTPAGGGTGAQPLSELTLTPCPLCHTGTYTLKRVRLRGNAVKSPEPTETRLAGITFRPWMVLQGQNPEECPRRDWSITIEFLTRKSPDWYERLFQATVRDAENQMVTRVAITKPEGGIVYEAMEYLCRQLRQWWVAPDHGAYSVDWLCGYIGRQDTTSSGGNQC